MYLTLGLKPAIRRIFAMLGVEVRRTARGSERDSRWSSPEITQDTLRASKIHISDVEHALSFAGNKFSAREIVLLADREIGVLSVSCQVIRCDQSDVQALFQCDVSSTVFVYACDSDSTGLPFIKEIIKRNGVFYPVQVYTPSSYANVDEVARKVVLSEFQRQTDAGFCKFDFGAGDSLNLIQAIAATVNVAGDYVEIGCYRGSSACVALAYMREIRLKRNCFFLDVFDGFTYQAAKDSADAMWAGTHETEGLDIVGKRILECCDPLSGLLAEVVKTNVIEDELPEQIADIALANIDVDLYEAVLAALVRIAPRMAVGGIVIVEDPGHTPALIGSRLAFDVFMQTPIASSFTAIYLESGQTFLVRLMKHSQN